MNNVHIFQRFSHPGDCGDLARANVGIGEKPLNFVLALPLPSVKLD
jgi:hypothetical protein